MASSTTCNIPLEFPLLGLLRLCLQVPLVNGNVFEATPVILH